MEIRKKKKAKKQEKIPCYFCGKDIGLKGRPITRLNYNIWGDWYTPKGSGMPAGWFEVPVVCSDCEEAKTSKMTHESYISLGLMRRIEMVGTCDPYLYDEETKLLIDAENWIVEPLLSGQRTIIHYDYYNERLSYFEGKGIVCADYGGYRPNVKWISERAVIFYLDEVVLDSIKIGDVYHVFDCLFCHRWLLNEPLLDRKSQAKKILEYLDNNRFVYVEPITSNIPEKGIIYKNKNSKYTSGFTPEWIARP